MDFGKESVFPRDFRISFCGGLLVLFPVDPPGARFVRCWARGRRRRRETLKRGRCDYEGGDAVGDAELFESKARKSQRREFGLEDVRM